MDFSWVEVETGRGMGLFMSEGATAWRVAFTVIRDRRSLRRALLAKLKEGVVEGVGVPVGVFDSEDDGVEVSVEVNDAVMVKVTGGAVTLGKGDSVNCKLLPMGEPRSEDEGAAGKVPDAVAASIILEVAVGVPKDGIESFDAVG